jgi:hypothetical protein
MQPEISAEQHDATHLQRMFVFLIQSNPRHLDISDDHASISAMIKR